jgi:hypothetical protein
MVVMGKGVYGSGGDYLRLLPGTPIVALYIYYFLDIYIIESEVVKCYKKCV